MSCSDCKDIPLSTFPKQWTLFGSRCCSCWLETWLCPGGMEFAELIKTSRVDNVVLSRPFVPCVTGTLCVTSHHLLLSSRAAENMELWLLISNIDAIEKRSSVSSGTITIKCKDLCVMYLEIPGMEECLNIASSIEALSSLQSITQMYPYFYRPKNLNRQEGWNLFTTEEEFTRLSANTTNWRLSYVNKAFAVCPTYPDAVLVLRSVDDEMLKAVARFRQGGRFPVLSYYHRKNGMVIMRSSQPMPGANGKRCKEDEQFLAAVLQPDRKGFIIETRSIQATHQARVKGGGFETKANYPNWKRLHRPIDRGRGLQESLVKLVDACHDQSNSIDRWLNKMEASKWLSHVKTILTTACLAAQCVEREGASVLIHGSEGRDATLQLTSLAQIILDPACRTVFGFQALVEREWLKAGHAFQQRCASSAYSHARLKHEAPVFLIFLDCCWQLCRQFPCSFEFNERFLIALFEHAYASSFGSFLCNNEKERFTEKVQDNSISLWAWVNQPSQLNKFLNPLYEKNTFALWPSVAPQSLQLWQGLFLRWNRSAQHLEEAWDQTTHIMEQAKRKPTLTNQESPGQAE
ncbi:myotubularin-related protein 9 isoform X2 [Callorhinchus milii]|uniref:myotubularin-related protein 9 isoform X2 n=1 Tax=Callorhinchus milii TaxID=7868 RepID=UPI0004573FFF|nr:myotubularin-related protein 9 isoform X2 [Callorhinchus milii]|eukprot:gi/632972114/ref/XP_007902502.1/ PREDICTED: myotubularin-related protein 9-like isoform X2 [Callorhinchus milii]